MLPLFLGGFPRRDHSDVVLAPRVDEDGNTAPSIHSLRGKPFFFGVDVFDGNRRVVKEYGDSVRKRDSVLA